MERNCPLADFTSKKTLQLLIFVPSLQLSGRGHCDLQLNLSSSHLRGMLRGLGTFMHAQPRGEIRAGCHHRDHGTELGRCCLGQDGPWCVLVVLAQWRSITAHERREPCCSPGCRSIRHGVGDKGCWQVQEAVSLCDREEGPGL